MSVLNICFTSIVKLMNLRKLITAYTTQMSVVNISSFWIQQSGQRQGRGSKYAISLWDQDSYCFSSPVRHNENCFKSSFPVFQALSWPADDPQRCAQVGNSSASTLLFLKRKLLVKHISPITFLNADVLLKAVEGKKTELDVNKQLFCCWQWWCTELSSPLRRAGVQLQDSHGDQSARRLLTERHATCEHVYVTKVPEKRPKAVTQKMSNLSFEPLESTLAGLKIKMIVEIAHAKNKQDHQTTTMSPWKQTCRIF